MITALYRWATYIAKKDRININNTIFNDAVERLVNNSASQADLQLIYEPIAHLFENDINNIDLQKYQISIITTTGTKRSLISNDLKYIMFPKKGLTGKAQQSIGGSIFARNALKWATEEAGGSFEKKEKIYNVTLPENNLLNFWRRRLLDTYFQSSSDFLNCIQIICSFCGISHRFTNTRFNPPINIFVENVTNYNSYLNNEPSHSICPYCNMLFMRTLVEEKGPEKIPFPKNKKAFIYVLPFDPENERVYEEFSRKKAEDFLKSELIKQQELNALYYLLFLPILIYKMLPVSLSGTFKPFVYIAFADKSKQAEEVSNQFVITRLDYLARVGALIYKNNGLNEIYKFQQRLLSFVSTFGRDQIINGYKLIFKFLAKLLSEGEVDFTFLRRILRNEISQQKRKSETIYLGGYNYLKAFLEAKKEVSDV